MNNRLIHLTAKDDPNLKSLTTLIDSSKKKLESIMRDSIYIGKIVTNPDFVEGNPAKKKGLLIKKLKELRNNLRNTHDTITREQYKNELLVLKDYLLLTNIKPELIQVPNGEKYCILSETSDVASETKFLMQTKFLMSCNTLIERLNNIADQNRNKSFAGPETYANYVRDQEKNNEFSIKPQAILKVPNEMLMTEIQEDELFMTEIQAEVIDLKIANHINPKTKGHAPAILFDHDQPTLFINDFEHYRNERLAFGESSIAEKISDLEMVHDKHNKIKGDIQILIKIHNDNINGITDQLKKKKLTTSQRKELKKTLRNLKILIRDAKVREKHIDKEAKRWDEKLSLINKTKENLTENDKKILRQALILERLLNNPSYFKENGVAHKHPVTRDKQRIKKININDNGTIRISFEKPITDVEKGILESQFLLKDMVDSEISKLFESNSQNDSYFASSTSITLSRDELINLDELILYPEFQMPVYEISKEVAKEKKISYDQQDTSDEDPHAGLFFEETVPKEDSDHESSSKESPSEAPEIKRQQFSEIDYLDERDLDYLKTVYAKQYRGETLEIIKKYKKQISHVSFLYHVSLNNILPIKSALKSMNDLIEKAKKEKGNLGFIMHVKRKLAFDIQQKLQKLIIDKASNKLKATKKLQDTYQDLKFDNDENEIEIRQKKETIQTAFNKAIELNCIDEFNEVLVTYLEFKLTDTPQFNDFIDNVTNYNSREEMLNATEEMLTVKFNKSLIQMRVLNNKLDDDEKEYISRHFGDLYKKVESEVRQLNPVEIDSELKKLTLREFKNLIYSSRDYTYKFIHGDDIMTAIQSNITLEDKNIEKNIHEAIESVIIEDDQKQLEKSKASYRNLEPYKIEENILNQMIVKDPATFKLLCRIVNRLGFNLEVNGRSIMDAPDVTEYGKHLPQFNYDIPNHDLIDLEGFSYYQPILQYLLSHLDNDPNKIYGYCHKIIDAKISDETKANFTTYVNHAIHFQQAADLMRKDFKNTADTLYHLSSIINTLKKTHPFSSEFSAIYNRVKNSLEQTYETFRIDKPISFLDLKNILGDLKKIQTKFAEHEDTHVVADILSKNMSELVRSFSNPPLNDFPYIKDFIVPKYKANKPEDPNRIKNLEEILINFECYTDIQVLKLRSLIGTTAKREIKNINHNIEDTINNLGKRLIGYLEEGLIYTYLADELQNPDLSIHPSEFIQNNYSMLRRKLIADEDFNIDKNTISALAAWQKQNEKDLDIDDKQRFKIVFNLLKSKYFSEHPEERNQWLGEVKFTCYELNESQKANITKKLNQDMKPVKSFDEQGKPIFRQMGESGSARGGTATYIRIPVSGKIEDKTPMWGNKKEFNAALNLFDPKKENLPSLSEESLLISDNLESESVKEKAPMGITVGDLVKLSGGQEMENNLLHNFMRSSIKLESFGIDTKNLNKVPEIDPSKLAKVHKIEGMPDVDESPYGIHMVATPVIKKSFIHREMNQMESEHLAPDAHSFSQNLIIKKFNINDTVNPSAPKFFTTNNKFEKTELIELKQQPSKHSEAYADRIFEFKIDGEFQENKNIPTVNVTNATVISFTDQLQFNEDFHQQAKVIKHPDVFLRLSNVLHLLACEINQCQDPNVQEGLKKIYDEIEKYQHYYHSLIYAIPNDLYKKSDYYLALNNKLDETLQILEQDPYASLELKIKFETILLRNKPLQLDILNNLDNLNVEDLRGLKQQVYENITDSPNYIADVIKILETSSQWIESRNGEYAKTKKGKAMEELRNTCIEILYKFFPAYIDKDAIEAEVERIERDLERDKNLKHMTGIENMRTIISNKNKNPNEPALVTLLNLKRCVVERTSSPFLFWMNEMKIQGIKKGRAEWATDLYNFMKTQNYLGKFIAKADEVKREEKREKELEKEVEEESVFSSTYAKRGPNKQT